MSAWGNKDDIASPGTVDISGLTVSNTAGSPTFFANNFSVGQVMDFGLYGSAVIKAIAGEGSLTLVSNTELTTGSATGLAYSVSEKPVNLVDGDATTLANTVFGVSVTEMQTSNTSSDVYRSAHAGWVKFGASYTDADGNTRQKSEVLVAMSSITGDADDDTGDVQLPE